MKNKLLVLVSFLLVLGNFTFADSLHYGSRFKSMSKRTSERWHQLLKDRGLAGIGDEEAQYRLAHAYEDSDVLAKDLEEAVQWYRLAAEQGHAGAQYSLAGCYFYGKGVEVNLEEAVKWYKLAAEQGHAKAQNMLGSSYFHGDGIAKDFEEAVKWYKFAAEQGDLSAQTNLAFCYYYGYGVSVDFEKAVKWYRLAAEEGDRPALYGLAECYKKGKGVEENLEEASRLLGLARGRGRLSSGSFLRISVVLEILQKFPKTIGASFIGLLGAIFLKTFPGCVSNEVNRLGVAQRKAIRIFIRELIRSDRLFNYRGVQSVLTRLANYIGADDFLQEMTGIVGKDVLSEQGMPDVLSNLIAEY